MRVNELTYSIIDEQGSRILGQWHVRTKKGFYIDTRDLKIKHKSIPEAKSRFQKIERSWFEKIFLGV